MIAYLRLTYIFQENISIVFLRHFFFHFLRTAQPARGRASTATVRSLHFMIGPLVEDTLSTAEVSRVIEDVVRHTQVDRVIEEVVRCVYVCGEGWRGECGRMSVCVYVSIQLWFYTHMHTHKHAHTQPYSTSTHTNEHTHNANIICPFVPLPWDAKWEEESVLIAGMNTSPRDECSISLILQQLAPTRKQI